jgi:hypothetical protein
MTDMQKSMVIGLQRDILVYRQLEWYANGEDM